MEFTNFTTKTFNSKDYELNNFAQKLFNKAFENSFLQPKDFDFEDYGIDTNLSYGGKVIFEIELEVNKLWNNLKYPILKDKFGKRLNALFLIKVSKYIKYRRCRNSKLVRFSLDGKYCAIVSFKKFDYEYKNNSMYAVRTNNRNDEILNLGINWWNVHFIETANLATYFERICKKQPIDDLLLDQTNLSQHLA